MIYALTELVLSFWNTWTGIFESLPYGDPYISSAALFVLVVVAAKLISDKTSAT